MLTGYKLWVPCKNCVNGAMEIIIDTELTEIMCPYCDGVGYIFFGWCSFDTFDLPEGLQE